MALVAVETFPKACTSDPTTISALLGSISGIADL
jgi:hypothetical protein